jgi:3-oxoacyl-[acyl-carrier protein] reductase
LNSSQKTALVTGGARGIGAAIVLELRSRSFAVSAPPRTELDLADDHSIDAFLRRQEEAGIRFDILINNAGINFLNPIGNISRESWLATQQVNLNAPFQLAQSLVAHMQAQRWGRIVNIASIFGIVTREYRAAYSAAKSALGGLTRALAVELGGENVLVNAVAPGYVETELTRQNNSTADLERIASMIPLKRLAQPYEIAKLVGFLCSEENTYITGQTLVADGGFTCL